MRVEVEELGLALDMSFLHLAPSPSVSQALDAMSALEAGAIANPDEGRQVGHYWLRLGDDAPEHVRADIQALHAQIDSLAQDWPFSSLLVIGIGGSALGPQLVLDALLVPESQGKRARFMDNTDPVGAARVLAELDLKNTGVLVISKSGGTKETRNSMLLAQSAYGAAGLDFGAHAIAVTGQDSALFKAAQGWRARVPMWDWVGGRTSLHSAVGLLPMALLGLDWRGFLEGARIMDARTRVVGENPALILAHTWWSAQADSPRAMVMLPYCDRLVLLSKYLQQLVMESLGKRRKDGQRVGLTVYGNKGSTDQHAYVQQLRDGPDDFFASFVAVLSDDKAGDLGAVEVEPGVRAGDFLLGFLLGTRKALHDAGKQSLTLELEQVNARSLGGLIALYERAVGFYATWLGVNAYHQPGVEAGKKAAGEMLVLQGRILAGEPADGPDAALIRRRLTLTGR
ncbi:MAG: glucose-6-phosphate isomerase [Cognaticolwellia sp.]|jgi:glucose-6-phosphate isomerase